MTNLQAYEREAIQAFIDAGTSLIRDLNNLIKKLNKTKKKKEEFVTIIDGEEYHSYREITDAYGCEMITEEQKDRALKKLEEWRVLNVNKTLDQKIDLIVDVIDHIELQISQKERLLENE